MFLWIALTACIGGSADDSAPARDTAPADSYERCETLEPAYQDELAWVQSCDADEDCGQVLAGTSCGCTRDFVARVDADTRRLYALIDQGADLECALLLDSTCDCPEADGFACDQGTCTWNYL